MKGYRKHTRQFKIDAVTLVIDEGIPVKIVAENLGVRNTMLYRWIEEYEKYGKEAFIGSGKPLTVEARLKQKDKVIAELKEENEILKKAAAYFSRKQQM